MVSAASLTVTIFLAGDVMTGRGVDQILPYPGNPELRESYARSATDYVELAERKHGPVLAPVVPSYIWGDALPILQSLKPAASIVNLETSITDGSDFWAGKRIHYRMRPENIGCLQAAHLDVCVLANNHMLDFGRPGLVETLTVLRQAGIKSAGAGRDRDEASRPVRLDLGEGVGLLVFSFGSESSGIPSEWAAGPARSGVNLLPDLSGKAAEEIVGDIRASKHPRDIAVVSIHWGSNWGDDISSEQVAFAHRLIDGGADVVHGHSSHHVRSVEVYKRKLILYGCGDLLTDYEGIGGHEEWRGDLGAMYFATLSRSDGALAGLRLVPVQMRRMRLSRVSQADGVWLKETLNRIGRPFGSRFEEEGDGSLLLRPAP